MNIIPFTKLFYGVHSPLYYQHGRHVKQGDPLGGLLFALAHYQILLKTIAWAPNCVFPSLTNDIHIVGPMSEIICAFDHLSTQLTLIGLRVKNVKVQVWSPLGIFPSIEILQGCTLIIDGLCILSVPMRFQDFAIHFLDEAYLRTWHISTISLSWEMSRLLWAFYFRV